MSEKLFMVRTERQVYTETGYETRSVIDGFFTTPAENSVEVTPILLSGSPDSGRVVVVCASGYSFFMNENGECVENRYEVEPVIAKNLQSAFCKLFGRVKRELTLESCKLYEIGKDYSSEEPEDIKKKVMSMYTDPNHLRVQDPGKVEGNPVFIYLDAFCRPEHFAEFLPEYQNLDELKAHYQRGGLGDVKVKKFLNSVMQAELEPIRTRRKEWEQRLPEVVEILKAGSAVAEKTAAATLADVRKSMRIDYFEDNNLLK